MDVIDRKAAIDAVKDGMCSGWDCDVIEALEGVPSAQPSDEYKRGWQDGRESLIEEIWENERERFD